MLKGLVLTLGKLAGAVVVGGTIGHVALQGLGDPDNPVVIHCEEIGGVVEVNGVPYPIHSWADTPLVLDLAPGSHTLRWTRGSGPGQMIRFRVVPGENRILTAGPTHP